MDGRQCAPRLRTGQRRRHVAGVRAPEQSLRPQLRGVGDRRRYQRPILRARAGPQLVPRRERGGSPVTRPVKTRYTMTAVVLHWLIAALLIAEFAHGWWMQEIPKIPAGVRANAFNLHKSV